MAVGIADRDACARTPTSYTDVGRVQRALGLRDDATIATVLTDRDGRITWMTTGAFTERAGDGLRAPPGPAHLRAGTTAAARRRVIGGDRNHPLQEVPP